MDAFDELPEYFRDEVKNRYATGGDGSTLIVDVNEEDFIVGYTGFTGALTEQYREACGERGEEGVKVVQLTNSGPGVIVTRYETASGENAEEIWQISP